MAFLITIRCPNHIQEGVAGEDYNLNAGYEVIQFPEGYENFEGEIKCGSTVIPTREPLYVKLENKILVYLYTLTGMALKPTAH